jgi:hypothetical protein
MSRQSSATERLRFTTEDDLVVIEHDYRVCTRCVLPESFPGIGFGVNGVCSYCEDEDETLEYDREAVQAAFDRWVTPGRPERSHDCLLLFSGGKDSSLALIRLVREHGLRVLAFTVDNGFLARRTGENMRRVLDATGADHVMLRPSRKLMHGVYRTALSADLGAETTKYSTAACGSCIGLVLSAGLRTAEGYGIPLLAGGWTPGQFTTSAFVPVPFLRDVARRNLDPITLASPDLETGLDGWRPSETGSPFGLVNPLYGEEYVEEQVLAELERHGWRAPEDTDSCSTNCRLNGLLVLDHLRRHGYHPYVYEIAHHVRLGGLTREEALHKLSRLRVRPATVGAVAVELDVPAPVPSA